MMCYNSACLASPLSQSYEIKARPMIPKIAFFKRDLWDV